MEKYIELKFNMWKKQLSEDIKYKEFDYDESFILNDCFCIESGLIENNYGYIIYLPRKHTTYTHASPKKFPTPKIQETSIITIASENKPYIDFLMENIKYNEIQKEIVFYGSDPNIKKQNISIHCFNDELHMSQARNRGIDTIKSEYGFILDIDTFLTINDFNKILIKYGNLCHYGVFCLRNNIAGNSFYFGQSKLFKENKFDERFKKFFYEDTEYLMNWSRIGKPIVHIHSDYDKKDHESIPDSGINFKTFVNIALSGR